MKEATYIDDLLYEAIANNATDLHISTGAPPRIRVHGELKNLPYADVTPTKAEELLKPLIDLMHRSTINVSGQSDLSYSVRELDADGNEIVEYDKDGQRINVGKLHRFRVNIFKQKGDYAGVFRVLSADIPHYSKLGLPHTFFNLYTKRRGLILIVGPTGSGKTTTLASFLDHINKNLCKHIITLEDPIEYQHWHSKCLVNQREIGKDCDTFADGLRAALREDPDVILVGEMRDLETTDIALKSAETGHLVCSTLHTLGVADTINRIVDMYPVEHHIQIRSMLASVLEAVVSQQLIPKADGSGFIIAYEIMYKCDKIKDYIRDGKIKEIERFLNTEEAKSMNMVSMDTVIYNLYKSGKIRRSDALDYAFNRNLLEQAIIRLDNARYK